MRLKVTDVNADAETLIPPSEPDGSSIGVNYADEYIKPMNVTLEDGRAVTCKRKGLKITMAIGDAQGDALMRRIEHGPDVKNILQQALAEAAQGAGASFVEADGSIYLEFGE